MMKENKNSRIGKFFETLIYTILMTLPLISVFVRSIYVQSNQNAYQSYTGETLNDRDENTFSTRSDLQNYTGESYINFSDVGATQSGTIYYCQCTFVSSLTTISQTNIDLINQSVRVYFYRHSSLTFYDVEGNTLLALGSSNVDIVISTYDTSSSSNSALSIIHYYTYNNYHYLDNVFEYSLQKIVNEYGKGNINFINWLGDLFFNNTNDLLYFNFVNLYLNYALVVSVAYLLWFVLNWMIKFVKSLLNGFLPKGDN